MTAPSPARNPSPTAGRKATSPSPPRSSSPLPHYNERTEDVGPYNSLALVRLTPKVHHVDFSYMDLDICNGLIAKDPRSGLRVRFKKQEEEKRRKAEEDELKKRREHAKRTGLEDLGESLFPQTKPADGRIGDGLVVMKAKDETYAFSEKVKSGIQEDEMDGYVFDEKTGTLFKREKTIEQLAAEVADVKYWCTSLRMSNNKLKSLHDLAFSLMAVLYKPSHYLNILDLSCNEISELPDDIGLMPIHTLLLHQNKINSMKQVTKLQCLFSSLKKLTLNGNPIQANEKQFKFKVLYTLPFLDSLDDVKVTVKDKDMLSSFEQFFVPKKKRGQNEKYLSTLKSPSMPSPAMDATIVSAVKKR